jgi:hypothetical protein
MSKPSAITVSRSKRGTTVKATGAAAQVLFDAMASRLEAGISPVRPGPHTVHFEDHGQDFLQWDIDAHGVVVASRPFQADQWCGSVLVGDAVPGATLRYVSPHDGQERSIRYPVAKVVHRVAEAPATPPTPTTPTSITP